MGIFRKKLFLLHILLIPLFSVPAAPLWSVELGTENDAAVLGFGWGDRGQVRGESVRWVDRLEADVIFESVGGGDREIVVRAAQEPVHWRRHRIGVWVNNQYVGEMPTSKDRRFIDYRFLVTENLLREGENTLTLRMAYRIRIGEPKYRFSLAINRIDLFPAGTE
jgi:hypothetical protein